MVSSTWTRKAAVAVAALASRVLANDILETSGFSSCGGNSDITVTKVNVVYNNGNKTITFDVAGFSTVEQNVTATLNVTAYGRDIFSNSFNPCADDTFVRQLCPVPEGDFSASGSQEIPSQFADMVPAIAFQIPDIAAQATLELNSAGGDNVACIRSQVSNGKTANVPAVSYVAAGIAGAALVLSGVSAVGSALAGGAGSSSGGAATASPTFTEVFGWFQGMAMNGMLSVNYPPVYRSFAKNFAFSTGVVSWPQLQSSIDSFRGKTGGNLTDASVEALQNATLVFPDGSSIKAEDGTFSKRAFSALIALIARNDVEKDSGLFAAPTFTVQGIEAYAQQLSVPSSDVFMTVLLVVSIIIAAIILSILIVKVVLEGWALFGNFPESLAGFRKHYWGSIARTITSLILLLYGVWVLWCVFQFTRGDSWAAKALAGVTLALFTGVLAFFSWKIWRTARKLKDTDGDTSGLYEDKAIWVKYSLFYESYRKNYWWIFVPAIVYLLVKGCLLAATDGHGMIQTIGQLIIEAIMLIVLLWSRPYERRSGNIINIVIQVVRVLSVICILVFVEEFGIAQTTQTVTGVVLIAVQSALTGILAILIAWNAINACCKANPHRKRRKEMEKLQRDMDDLTPLDARNSLLLDRPQTGAGTSIFSVSSTMKEKSAMRPQSSERYAAQGDGLRPVPSIPGGFPMYRALTPTGAGDSAHNLIQPTLPLGSLEGRQPTLPNLNGYGAGGYGSAYRYPDNGGAQAV